MRSPGHLVNSFSIDFPREISEFLLNEGLISSSDELLSSRFLRRSILPHLPQKKAITKLMISSLKDAVASSLVLEELKYFIPEIKKFSEPLRFLDMGSSPGAVFTSAHLSRSTLFSHAQWVLSAPGPAMERLGRRWATHLQDRIPVNGSIPVQTLCLSKSPFGFQKGKKAIAPFHLIFIRIETLQDEFDPLWSTLARKHLVPGGLLIFIQVGKSSLRSVARQQWAEGVLKSLELTPVLPCLGTLHCGAVKKGFSCDDSIKWTRPPYLQKIDTLTGKNHSPLRFSYMAFQKEVKPNSLLSDSNLWRRLDTPTPNGVFHLCGKSGLRTIIQNDLRKENPVEGGDILRIHQCKGSDEASRLMRYDRICPSFTASP